MMMRRRKKRKKRMAVKMARLRRNLSIVKMMLVMKKDRNYLTLRML
ncbi:hypothetical protein NXF25_000150 [Crotalus adamanteus]|uniref:Uncharacterized protein n=1 Tax=Crotalus adamanteus TaxID=8729 RepID=A0AAW1C5W9_CROAD